MTCFWYRISSISIILCICTCSINAQETILKGQLEADGLERSFIEIVNLNQYKVSVSQPDGKFEIEAEAGDTILITSVQYNEHKFMVKQEYFHQTVIISLKEKVNQLQSVNLYSMGLTGDLKKDALSVKTNVLTLEQLGFDAKVEYSSEPENRYSEKKRMEKDFLYQLIDPNYKSRYKDLSDDETDKLNHMQFKLVVPENHVIDELNIESNRVDDFIVYCFENYPHMSYFLKRRDKLLLFEMLPKMAAEYLKYKRGE
jgi:hypothetical protein